MNVKKTPREIMQEIQWFSDLKPEHFEKMVQIASLHNLPADSEIFREGDRQDKL